MAFVAGVGVGGSVRAGRATVVCRLDVGKSIRVGAAGAMLGFAVAAGGPAGIVLADINNDIVREAAELVKRNSLNIAGIDLDAVLRQSTKDEPRERDEAYATIRRMMKSLEDKYARFLTPEDFNKLAKYDITGLGLLLSSDQLGRFIVAATPRPDTSAAQESVHRGDVVEAIAGVPSSHLTPASALEMLQGEEGSSVTLLLKTADQPTRKVTLVRKNTVENPVKYKMKEVNGKRVGYIRMKEFNAASNLGVRDAIQELEKEKPDYYALDLRSNLGGVVEGALDVAGLFMESNVPAVKVTDKTGHQSTLFAKEVGKHDLIREPMVVITDKYSASASEVLLSALRENCRAVSVGQTTYGKGVIQGVFGLSDGSAVVLTVAKYLTPKGNEINGMGISPDIVMRQPGRLFDARLDSIDFEEVNGLLKACTPVR